MKKDISVGVQEHGGGGYQAFALDWDTGNRWDGPDAEGPDSALTGLVRYLVQELQDTRTDLNDVVTYDKSLVREGYEYVQRWRCLVCDPLGVDLPDVVDTDKHNQWHARLNQEENA